MIRIIGDNMDNKVIPAPKMSHCQRKIQTPHCAVQLAFRAQSAQFQSGEKLCSSRKKRTALPAHMHGLREKLNGFSFSVCVYITHRIHVCYLW